MTESSDPQWRQSTTGSRFIVMSTAEVDALFELVESGSDNRKETT